jgi:hypothetical protein
MESDLSVPPTTTLNMERSLMELCHMCFKVSGLFELSRATAKCTPGTSVAVLGTIDVVNTTLGFDPSWECFVDNISISIGPDPKQLQHSPENNQVLCEREHLNDESHNITVKISTTGRPFWLDYIQFNPSPSLSLETAVIRVESGDTGVFYDTNWKTTKTGLARLTQVKDSSARFSFTGMYIQNYHSHFGSLHRHLSLGTSVTWIGFISHKSPHDASSAVYAIDGNPPTPFHLNGPLSNQGAVPLVNQIFFTTPELPAGQHTLVVTHQGTGDQTPLTLDYLHITNASTPMNPSVYPPPSPTNRYSKHGAGPHRNDTDMHKPDPGAHNLPNSVLVGVPVICGVLLISIAIFIWWYTRGRKKRSPKLAAYHFDSEPSGPPPMYDPSTLQIVSPYEKQADPPVWSPRRTSSASTSFTSLSGYSPATITQTRAMREYEEQVRPLPVHPVLHQDSDVRVAEDKVLEV